MAANSVDTKDINFGQFLRLFGNATGYELSKRLKQYADRNNHPKLSQFADRSMNGYMGRGMMVIQQAKAKANAERAYKESGYNPNSKRSSNNNQSPSINTASYSMRGVTPRQPSGNLSLRQNITNALKSVQTEANRNNNQNKLKGTTVISATKYANRTPVNPSNDSKPVTRTTTTKTTPTKTTPKPATRTVTSTTPKKDYIPAPIKDRNGRILTQEEIDNNAKYDDAVLERMTQLHNIGKDKDDAYLKANFDSNNRLIGTSLQHPKTSRGGTNFNSSSNNSGSSSSTNTNTPKYGRNYLSNINFNNPNQYTPTIEQRDFVSQDNNGNLTPESLDNIRNSITGLDSLDAMVQNQMPEESRRTRRYARRNTRRASRQDWSEYED